MRYKSLAIIAVMMIGIGVLLMVNILNKDDGVIVDPDIQEKYQTVEFYAANRDLASGLVVRNNDLTLQTKQFRAGEQPEWVQDAVTKDAFTKIMTSGAVLRDNLAKGGVLKNAQIEGITQKFDKEFVTIPISVSAINLINPHIGDSGFIDIYLLANSNDVYDQDIYNKTSGGKGLDYKDTRVKLFAKNVYFVRNNDALLNVKENSSSPPANNNANGDITGGSVIYVYFPVKSVEKVIQAQILGMFFLIPAHPDNINSGVSQIITNSREVTPAEVIAGAAHSVTPTRIQEIRGTTENAR
ncbi:hypothetical protein [Dryocola clanedunensis]